MSEKFFTINKDSDFYAAYMQFKKDLNNYWIVFNEFLEIHEIEATEYVPSDKCVMIIPTENDLKKFDGMFTKKTNGCGVRYFKKNCAITRDWLETVKTKHLKVPVKPSYLRYGLMVMGKVSSRCFMVGDILYGAIKADSDIELLNFMTEIKGSVFWKVVEDEEERLKNAK